MLASKRLLPFLLEFFAPTIVNSGCDFSVELTKTLDLMSIVCAISFFPYLYSLSLCARIVIHYIQAHVMFSLVVRARTTAA
jgi:hypothetical protein